MEWSAPNALVEPRCLVPGYNGTDFPDTSRGRARATEVVHRAIQHSQESTRALAGRPLRDQSKDGRPPRSGQGKAASAAADFCSLIRTSGSPGRSTAASLWQSSFRCGLLWRRSRNDGCGETVANSALPNDRARRRPWALLTALPGRHVDGYRSVCGSRVRRVCRSSKGI